MLLIPSNLIIRGLMLAVAGLTTAVVPRASSAQSNSSPPVSTQSSDFRIDTDVMESGKGEPIYQSVTLFSNGVSYEFSRESPNKITVIDTVENRVTFIDKKRQLQTRVNLQELQAYIETARKQFAQANGGALKLQDAAEVSFDSSTQVLTAGKQFIRYDAKLQQPENSSVAEYYANFANASAILSAWESRGTAPPPFARMQLNQAVREKAAIPSEIKRTIFIGKTENSLTSRIHATYTLSPSEKKQLTEYSEMMLNYPTVAWAEYTNTNSPLNR